LTWMQKIFSRPLYSDIIHMARTFGLRGAAANAMQAGFTYEGKKTVELHPDFGFMNTHIFLELIGPRAQLEAFFVHIQPLIGEHRVTTFAELEHWGPVAAAAVPHVAVPHVAAPNVAAPHVAEETEREHKAS
jgi:hypothetical protein